MLPQVTDAYFLTPSTATDLCMVADSTGQETQEDDEGTTDEREIWQVTDVTEEDFETTEGESVDLYEKLMAMAGWTVRDHALT